MNTIKNIIHTYRWYFLFATLASQFMGMVNLMNIAATYPEFNRSDLCAYWDSCILFCLISFIVSLAITELRTPTIYMLPASLLRKYATAFGIILYVLLSCLLFSMAIECAGSFLVAGSEQEASFAIGGYIRYLSEQTGGYSILAALIALEIFVTTLINKRSIEMLTINSFLGGLSWGIIVALHQLNIFNPPCNLFWAIAIILIIASYQIFKRWQPANSGFLTI